MEALDVWGALGLAGLDVFGLSVFLALACMSCERPCTTRTLPVSVGRARLLANVSTPKASVSPASRAPLLPSPRPRHVNVEPFPRLDLPHHAHPVHHQNLSTNTTPTEVYPVQASTSLGAGSETLLHLSLLDTHWQNATSGEAPTALATLGF